MADYNINAVTRRVVYTGSAGLGPYAFTFEILDQNDIAVYFNTTKLTLTTDYTVTINANGTGSITIVTGSGVPSTPDADDTITIVGARDIERTTDFVTAGDLRAAALNEQLDGLTIFDQQLAEENKRTLKAPVTDPAHVDEGGTLDMTLPSKTARAGKYLQFNSTTGNPEAGPDSTDVTALADIATDIATLADIEDGTDATDAIQTVAGISSNVTTVAGIASNVSTVAGIQSDVTAVAADATDIGTVATNIASVNTVAGNITEVIAVANDLNEAVSEVETVANDLNEAVSEIETVAASISNVDTVGTNIANVNTVAGNNTNISTVAGISSNVTTVAGISGNVTTVAGISSDVTTVAADGTDIGTVATNISNVNTVAGISSNVTTVAGNNANVTTVASNIADVNTVAGSITDVNTFAVRYRIASSAPATSLDEGDLYFDTTDNQMYVYTGSAWVAVSPDLVADTTPQLGGNLDLNGNDITGTGNIDIAGNIELAKDAPQFDFNDTAGGTQVDYRLKVDAGEFSITDVTNSYEQVEIAGGIVKLRHNGSTKVSTSASGIDVTGTVTADGLTVDTGIVTVNNTGTRKVEISGNGYSSFTDNPILDGGIEFTNQFGHVFSAGVSNSNNFDVLDGATKIARFAGGGDVSLYDSSGVSQGFFWDASAQALGLGTTSPGALLHSNGSTAGDTVLRLSQSGSSETFNIKAGISGVDNDAIVFNNSTDGDVMTIRDGKIGIGSTAPSDTVELNASVPTIRLTDSDNNYYAQLRANSGNLNLRADHGNGFAGTVMTFELDGSEAARLDSSGNLLVGTTSSINVGSGSDVGVMATNNGGLVAYRSSDIAAFFGRQSTNGDIVQFRKGGTTVGSIGVDADSTNLMIGNGVVGLRFVEGSNQIRPANIDTGGNRDDVIDLGYGSARFDDIYATNGTIQTSDANEKQDIEALSDAEQRVAVAAKGLLRKYRWKDSVAEKGDDARIHFGIIAQDLKAAFEAEGLDAGRYAMFINSEWTDEETGEQKSRMGIRYNQLLAFIIAAI